MNSTVSIVVALSGLLAGANPAGDGEVELLPYAPHFRIEAPEILLTGTPVERITITARNADGSLDSSYNGRPLVRGVKLTTRQESGAERDTELGAFTKGRLVLETDLAAGRKVFVTEPEIVVNPEGQRQGRREVYRVYRWFSFVPPVLAIVLAVWLRNAILALFVGVWSGAVLVEHGNFFLGFVRTLDTYLIGELVTESGGEYPHLLVIFFTLFLGAMVGVMSRSGGTLALVNGLARYARTREHGQLMTWLMGFVIFFDDYANTLLVGTTMRPMTDRLKISREKLAFLVDSTAAPVAGLAMVSTWVGVEVGYIEDAYGEIFGGRDIEWNSYAVFLSTMFFRFYPLHLLVFVLLIAYSGHDYGPMLRAEARAVAYEQVVRPGTVTAAFSEGDTADTSAAQPLLRNALVPLIVLLFLVVAGLWWTGSQNLAQTNYQRGLRAEAPLPATLWNLLSYASANRVLFLSSFSASVTAIAIAAISKSLTVRESLDGWAQGARSMFLPLLVLVLAWGVATMCDAEHLNTSGVLVQLTQGNFSANWMPTAAFLLSAAVAFATGTSWATMGLLMPLFISVTYGLLVDVNEGSDPTHPLLLATIGAILGGAIFGDHCSPISDTTVLSSAASGCDLVDHVTTQSPYALSVAGVALLLGYVPIGFGFWQPMILMPLGLVVIYLLTQFLGRPVEEYTGAETAVSPAGDGLPDFSDLDLGEDSQPPS